MSKATVKVWEEGRMASYDEMLEDDPVELEMEIQEGGFYVHHEDHVVIADNVRNHKKYAFFVEADQPVKLMVETNDSYHSPIDGFTNNRPIEGGLIFADMGESPFKVELWGRVRMRVEPA